MNGERRFRKCRRGIAEQAPADQPASDDSADLTGRRRDREGEDRGADRDRGALAVRAQIARHPPHGLSDDRYGDNLQAVQPSRLGRSPNSVTPYPKRIIARADGIVNPSQAAKAPGRPARRMPRLIPTWLLAGPGRNWQRATISAKAGSSSHRRRSTNSAPK